MKTDKEFELDLLSLKEGTPTQTDYRLGEDFFEARDTSDVIGADVEVTLNAEKRHEGYMLEFDFAGYLEVPCDRCLEPVRIPIDTTYDIMVRHGEEFDDSREDLLVIPDNRNSLDVSGLIYDTLMLEIPLRRVHPEGQCNPEMLDKLGQC